ncbi:MAG: LysR family transcriptional regulator, partial [Burkholderiaceae bacterium]|nr:LysR family transcriptional regulator [Burkholderiaceae bacterium]
RKRGTPLRPEDLSSHDCLFYPRPTGAAMWSFDRRAARKAAAAITLPVNGPFSANNSETLRDAALDDLGIALLPDFSAQTAVRSGKLVMVLPDWRVSGPFAEQLYVLRPYTSHVPRAVSLFVSYLRECFADGFPLSPIL